MKASQIYDESPVSVSSIAEAMAESGDQFYNNRDPNLAIQHEKPEHRIVIFLKAQGMSNREIAQRTKFTEPWVSQILRQPWARRKLIDEIARAGKEPLSALIECQATDSVFTLVELRDDPDVESSVRRAAADSLLDRFLGKPTQKVETKNTNINVAAKLEDVDRQLAEVEAEERRLVGETQPAHS